MAFEMGQFTVSSSQNQSHILPKRIGYNYTLSLLERGVVLEHQQKRPKHPTNKLCLVLGINKSRDVVLS